MKFNAKKWVVLVVGEKLQKTSPGKLGKGKIGELNEGKYQGVWIKKKEIALNHVLHLIKKGRIFMR